MNTILEIGTAGAASATICASVSAEPLLTVLISFGISLITIVGGEVIKLCTAYLQKKTKEIKGDEQPKGGNENGNTTKSS